MPINLQKAEFILSAASPKDFIRDELPQVAFAGRSNVGKSSVINRLLNRKNLARVGAAPGKTTHINYFNIDRAFYLVDLPGYGYAKVSNADRQRWDDLINSYFGARRNHTLLVQLIDCRHDIGADDVQMLRYLHYHKIPYVVALTKADKLKKSQLEETRQAFEKACLAFGCRAVILTSAENGYGIAELQAVLNEAAAAAQAENEGQADGV